MREVFDEFLKKHEAYRKFYKNFKRSICKGKDATSMNIAEHFNTYKETCQLFLILAFTWSETPEGSKYWIDLNDLWGEEIGKMEKKGEKDAEI